MGRKYKIILGLAPMLVLYIWLIVGGMTHILIESLGYIPNLGFMNVSLQAYREILQLDGFWLNLVYSVYIAVVATTIATSIGVLIAYYLSTTSNKSVGEFLNRILRLGMILPYLYMIFLVILTFGRTGILSRLLLILGLIEGMEDMPSILYSRLGIGVIIVFVAKGIPFVTLFTLNVMSGINSTYKDVASSLGCNKRRLLLRLYVPMSKDVIIWTSAVLLAYTFGSFEVPYILSSLRPNTLSVSLYSLYSSPSLEMIPTTMALTMVMFIIGALLIIAYTSILRRLLRGYKS